jgi:hypothetical protein
MFSLLELQGQSSLLHKTGTVEINTEYHAARKPAWLVLLKLLGVTAMVGVGAAIAMPTLLESQLPVWQAAAITLGVMMIYTGIAFFVRPEPDTDNLGWGGGVMNDPFQCSDNVNRFLWRAHCVLGPGRFTAETLLDLCVLLGLAKTEETKAQAPLLSADAGFSGAPSDTTLPLPPLPPLDIRPRPATTGNFSVGTVQLDSQRFFAT